MKVFGLRRRCQKRRGWDLDNPCESLVRFDALGFVGQTDRGRLVGMRGHRSMVHRREVGFRGAWRAASLLAIVSACSGEVTTPSAGDAGGVAEDARISEPIHDGSVSADAQVDVACDYGARGDLFGLNVSFGDPLYLDDAAELGAHWLRIEVRFPLRPLSHYASVIDAAHARGMKVLLLVGYGSTPGKPPWHAGAAEWDPYRAAFHDDLVVIADTLGASVDAWEIWNEPDHQLDGGYDPGIPPDQYGLLLADAIDVIRSRSHGLIVGGGLATKRYSYWDDAVAAAGGSLDLDGVGVHTYGPPTWSLAQVRAELDLVIESWHQATGKELWLTEAGGVAHPAHESFAADYVALLFDHVWAEHADKVRSIEYFSWSDAVGIPGEAFGLVRDDGTRKPGFDEYASRSPTLPAESCPGPGSP